MQTKLIYLFIIIQSASFLRLANAQNPKQNLERTLQRYIEENNLFETYPFDSNLEVGDTCLVSTTQNEGVCRKIEDCQSVAEKFVRNRQLDDICRFSRRKGRISVCCPRRNRPQGGTQNQPQIQNPIPTVPAPISRTEPPITAAPVITVPVTAAPVPTPAAVAPSAGVNTLRKSYIKCEEYKKYAKKVIASVGASRLTREAPVVSIVGGKVTMAAEFPHMTAIGWTLPEGNVEWKCGGSLISANFVMTAAHCNLGGSEPDVVQISDKNIKSPIFLGDQHRISILEIIIHPNYVKTSSYNDIALLKLSKNAVLNSQLRPACLYQTETIQETKFIITGWGHEEFGGAPSAELLKAEVDRVDQATCEQKYAADSMLAQGILKTQLCAGDPTGKSDACQGDSGGPLQVKLPNNVYYIVGITSFGRGCASKNTPGVYTRVASFLDWIESVVWP